MAKVIVAALVTTAQLSGCSAPTRINDIQFIGSHNSYKVGLSEVVRTALLQRNPDAAVALDYAHRPIAEQLDMGIRKLELDLFVDPTSAEFIVGHVQEIDMLSHCSPLAQCLEQILSWSALNPQHIPIWISFNLKDQAIPGLPTPQPFRPATLDRLDNQLRQQLAQRLITPAQVLPAGSAAPPDWPTLNAARGKFLLLLDEAGPKRDWYWRGWRQRPMFTNAPLEHPSAAVLVRNDPVAQIEEIKTAVSLGYMVRTRADADTKEARTFATDRRDAAFASGAQAISTDYYVADPRLSDYEVQLPNAEPGVSYQLRPRR